MNDDIGSASESSQPLFTVTGLGAGAEENTFAPHSVTALKLWLQRERDSWMWLRSAGINDWVVATMRARQWWAEDEILQYIANYEADPSANTGAIIKAGQRIASRYHEQHALHSSSPFAVYVNELAKKDARVAASAALIFLNETPQNPDRFTNIGTALAASFLYGVGAPAESFKAAWKETQRTISTEHEDLRRTAGAAAEDWAARARDIAALHGEQKKTFDENQAARAIEYETQTKDLEKRLKQIEDTFKSAIALRSSVTYFTSKADEHKKTGRRFAIASGAVAAVAAIAVVVIAFSVFGVGQVATNTEIGVALILGFLVLWLLRLLVRILLSNLHLETDMRNRATLVQAYLALIAEGAALKEEDRGQIVSLVFRPTSDGLVKDDAAPPTPGAVVQNMMSR